VTLHVLPILRISIRTSGERGRERRDEGRKHGFHYTVKYTSDNHGKSTRKRQERRREKMTVKNKQRKYDVKEEYLIGRKEVSRKPRPRRTQE
jgi:hypothetical protein